MWLVLQFLPINESIFYYNKCLRKTFLRMQQWISFFWVRVKIWNDEMYNDQYFKISKLRLLK